MNLPQELVTKIMTSAVPASPYSSWVAAYNAARSKAAKLEVFKRTAGGEFGDQVRHSLFGLGEFDAANLPDAKTIKSMVFYAKLETDTFEI